jgi:hypothetical protein
LFVDIAEEELIEVLRRCLEVVMGGLDRSFLTGSTSDLDGALTWPFEEDLVNPVLAGLLMLARDGGCRVEALLIVLPVALGGRAMLLLVSGLEAMGALGKRLGD